MKKIFAMIISAMMVSAPLMAQSTEQKQRIVEDGGTYLQPHGGEFSVVALAWLPWQLKGDKEAARMFKGDDNLLQKRKDWTLEKNEKFSKLK